MLILHHYHILCIQDLKNLVSVYAQVDVNKFGQVVRNLISNALKFTPKGGTVHVTAVQHSLQLFTAEPTSPSTGSNNGDVSSVSNSATTKDQLSDSDRSDNSPSRPTASKPSQCLASPRAKHTVTRPSPLSVAPPQQQEPTQTAAPTKTQQSVTPTSIHSNGSKRKTSSQTPSSSYFRISVEDSGYGISEVI